MKPGYNEKGEEVLDQTPVELPIGFKRPMPLNQRLAEIARQEMLALQRDQELDETPEEADDFEVEDDQIDPSTPWEEESYMMVRENEVHHGIVKEDVKAMDEKIQAGLSLLDKYKQNNSKSQKKPKPKAREQRPQDDESDSDTEE